MTHSSVDVSKLSAAEKRALLAELRARRARQQNAHPQSFAQQRIWFFEQLRPETALFNVPAAVRIRGRRWQIAEAERAITEVARRHQILRTTFDHIDGQPVQLIGAAQPIKIPVVDLRELPAQEREAEVERLIHSDARRPFDLVRGPLLRFNLLVTGDNEQVIYFNMHHLIADGPSVAVLLRELALLYLAYCNRLPSPLPKLAAQYTDFARWQREAADGELFGRQLAHWKERLHGVPAVLDLPTDRARPAVARFRGGREHFEIPQKLAHALRNLGQHEGVTQFMVLMAAFQTLLYRYGGQDRFCVGSPVTGRNRTEYESLIGCFANLLVFPADFRGDPTFSELLARTRQATLGAFDNQDLPFERVVDALDERRDLSRAPLFQVLFTFSSLVGKQQGGFERLAPGLELGGLQWEQLEINTGTSMFDLSMWIDELPDRLNGMVDYDTDLFEAASIRRLLAHFRMLLERIVAEPDCRVSRLSLLAPKEQQSLLVSWNQTQRPLPDVAAAHQLFEEYARQAPLQTALVFEHQQRTYAEVNAQADALAGRLRQLGIGAETLVAICLGRSMELVIAMLGVLKAGGAFLPLDPAYPRGRLQFMLDDSKAALLVTDSSLEENFGEFAGQKILLDGPDALASAVAPPASVDVRPDHLAYAIYTSGSTGQPKAVAIEHRGLVNLVAAQREAFRVAASSRVLQFASPSFDAAISEIFVTLCSGATLIMAPQETLQDPDALLKLLRDEHVSCVTLTPSLLRLLPSDNLPELATLVSAGEACTADIVDRWAPGRRFINAYGPTETTVCATLTECRAGEGPPPIGRPIANTRVYVLDRHRQPVSVGVPGELHVGGRGVARGYLNQPALTTQRFVDLRIAGAPNTERVYATGDRVRWREDGQLEYLGRIDDQVKVRGMRVELGEVEAQLQTHPLIHEAAVMVRSATARTTELVAVCVPQASAALTADELRAFLAERLPPFMVPSHFTFADRLQRQPNGKIDRKVMLAASSSPAAPAVELVAPRDDFEKQLVAIWQQVLGVRDIGVRDNFFALGGHSLSAVLVKYRIEEEMRTKLPLATLFRASTIEQLAAELQKTESGTQSLVPLRESGTEPPLLLVHPTAGNALCYLELAKALDDRPIFGMQSIGLDGQQPPRTSIAEMAAGYVAELLERQPDGPFVLGGWSMGGVIAWEMAQQLAARGREASHLVLIDAPLLEDQVTQPPGAAPAWREFALAELQNQVGDQVDIGSLVDKLPTDSLPTAEQLQELLAQSPLAELAKAAGSGEELRYHLAVVAANLEAHQQYRAQPYAGRVVLFCADQQLDSLPDCEPQWRRLVTGEFEVHRTPGNHYTMLEAPNVEWLAAQLQSAIR